MARVTIPVINVSRFAIADAGLIATAIADTTGGGLVAANSGNGILYVVNGDGANPHSFSVEVTLGRDGQAVSSRTYTVSASSRGWVGPFPVNDYGNFLLVDSGDASGQLTYRMLLLTA